MQEIFVDVGYESECSKCGDIALGYAESQLGIFEPRDMGRNEAQVNLGMRS
jgi:hypothetical protein